MRLALPLLLLAACGPPREVIAKDEQLREAVKAGVVWLETEAQCQLFTHTDGEGSSRDWNGPFPTLGKIRVADGYQGDRLVAYTQWRPNRARIEFRDSNPHPAAVVHELGHALGLGHVGRDGVVMSEKAALRMDADTRAKFRQKCMD